MRTGVVVAASLVLLFSFISAACAVTDEEMAVFVEKEAYIIADKLKLKDLVRQKTRVAITAYRIDPSGIHWLAADVQVYSRRYGACAVALQLKFVEDEDKIQIVSSKGVLAALDLNKGVEKYRAKLKDYKSNVTSQGAPLTEQAK
jgi:hypothetical protein